MLTVINEQAASATTPAADRAKAALAHDALNFTIVDIHVADQEAGRYRQRVDESIRKANPDSLNVFSMEAYDKLLDLMVEQLKQNRGTIIADDYNFNIRHFNDWHKLACFIDEASLDFVQMTRLKDHYAERIIACGMEVDLRDEIARIHGSGN